MQKARQDKKKLVGVTLHFCDDQGKASTVDVDVKAVKAVSWTKQKVKYKPKDKKGKDTIPGGTGVPTCAEATALAADYGVCWWDGKQWVCGEEEA